MIKYFIQKINGYLGSSDLKAKIAKGGFWLSIGTGSENLLRLVRNMILTRILAPEVFGLMAIILAVNFFLESFTQIGVKESIIQSPKGDQESYLNGAFWLSSGRGIILFGLGVIAAPWIANFYKYPEIVTMMQVSFLGIVFWGLISPKSYSELKGMNYKKWIILYNGGSIIGILTAITLSFIMHNLWALVIGYTVESFSRTVLSYIFCPFIPSLEFEKDSLDSLFHFARKMTGIPILVFLYNKLDVFVLGRMISISELGMYSMAQVLARTPFMLVGSIFNPILLPAFSSIQDNQILLSKRILQSTKYISLIFFPLLTLMACFAEFILFVIYGKRYVASSTVFIFFCSGIAFTIIGSILVNILIAIGKPQLTRNASMTRLVVMGVLLIPLINRMDANGAALASLIASVMWFFFLLLKTKSQIGISLMKYFASLWESVSISLVIFVLYYFWNFIFGDFKLYAHHVKNW